MVYSISRTSLGAIAAMALSVIACNITLIGWVKSDTQRDMDRIEHSMGEMRNEMRDDMNSFKAEVRGWREDMHKQSSDFHARLTVLEHKHK